MPYPNFPSYLYIYIYLYNPKANTQRARLEKQTPYRRLAESVRDSRRALRASHPRSCGHVRVRRGRATYTATSIHTRCALRLARAARPPSLVAGGTGGAGEERSRRFRCIRWVVSSEHSGDQQLIGSFKKIAACGSSYRDRLESAIFFRRATQSPEPARDLCRSRRRLRSFDPSLFPLIS